MFVKYQQYQDNCIFCTIKRANQPLYKRIWFRRPTNVYRDPIVQCIEPIYKTIYTKRRNQRQSSGFVFEVVNYEATRSHIQTFLQNNIQFQCRLCHQTWCRFEFIVNDICGFCQQV